MKCTIETKKHYACVICYYTIHGGAEGCACSTYREEQFEHASICTECAEKYDKLMSPELKPVVVVLMNKAYTRGAGAIMDF